MNFISYSRKDSAYAAPVAQLLRASGQEVFVDIQSLQHGTDYREQIAETIARSERLFLIWSASAAVSSEVAAEWQHALATPACTIIPIPVDSTPLPAEIAHLHGVAEFDQLIQVIRSKERASLWVARGSKFALITLALVAVLWAVTAGVRAAWPADTTVVNELPLAVWVFWKYGPLKAASVILAAVWAYRMFLGWKLQQAKSQALDAVFGPVTGGDVLGAIDRGEAAFADSIQPVTGSDGLSVSRPKKKRKRR